MQPRGPSADSIDLLCQGVSSAERLAGTLAVVAVIALALAWHARQRAAAAGHGTLWAFVALLLGAMHVLVCFAVVPSGCVSDSIVTTVLVSASPWAFAGLLLHFAIAPVPPSLRTDIDDEAPR